MTMQDAIRAAKEVKAVAVVEKNGNYQYAKDWNEVDYAEKNGWKRVGHPTEL